MKNNISRLFILSSVLIFVSCTSKKVHNPNFDKDQWKTNYPYVFVHGLEGWGDYDYLNAVLPYWGLASGSLVNQLNKEGFNCASASMSRTGSAWDRACELYAQLTGTVVDYGFEHSTRCKHARYGTDYSGKALVKKWDAKHKVNFLAHSFGGVSVRLMADLLAYGSEVEKNATPKDQLSPLFAGGHDGFIYSIITASTPHNGVSALTINEEGFEGTSLGIIALQYAVAPIPDGRDPTDCTGYDMHIDVAAALNKKLHIHDNIYYFSLPTSATHRMLDGTYIPDKNSMEVLFTEASALIGKYKGQTPSGFEITEEWRQNDGIVNTISAKAPFTEPSKDLDIEEIEPGIWNVAPVTFGDHFALLGGITKKFEIRNVYIPLFDLINKL